MVERTSAEVAESERGRRGVPLLVWVLVAIVVYVLSVGPAERFCHGGPVLRWTLVIYDPLRVASMRSASVRRVYDWYVYDVWRAQRWWSFD